MIQIIVEKKQLENEISFLFKGARLSSEWLGSLAYIMTKVFNDPKMVLTVEDGENIKHWDLHRYLTDIEVELINSKQKKEENVSENN